MTTSDADYEELPPDPAATIESLRSLRYDLGSAIADIIDNSIAAEAKTIAVRMDSRAGWMAVIDDGQGMSAPDLTSAMRIGSQDPLDVRAQRDLGRFGFGLKTASFSQARELTVWSRRKGRKAACRSWDIDVVRSRGKWLLRKSAPPGASRLLDSLIESGTGTIVLWRRLDWHSDGADDIEAQHFRLALEEVSNHLEMVFERFLESGISVKIGSHLLQPWDPFARDHSATQELPLEQLALRGHPIVVRPYVLPHESKLTSTEAARLAGPGGWNAQQGFYLYRRDRLVTAGDWFNLGLSRQDLYGLARIALEVPTELDKDFKLDVAKSGVVVPRSLHGELRRIAEVTRKRAAAVRRHRDVPVKRAANRHHTTVWSSTAKGGVQSIRLNRSHPVLTALISSVDDPEVVRTALDLIEETVPAQLLPSIDTEHRPLAGETAEDLLRLAEKVYESYLRDGKTRSEAAQRLLHTEPFYLYPAITEYYGEMIANP